MEAICGTPALVSAPDTREKLALLSEASQYDLACACGTGDRDRRHRGGDGTWLYPVTLPNGGYAVMLKTLLSNVCVNDCGYCPYRTGVDAARVTLGPEEVARVFMDYVRARQVFGLFLSSGVIKDADYTMERMHSVARILRRDYAFRGYIHLKVLPGTSDAALEETLSLASAVSLNIETPGEERFAKLSGTKRYLDDIIRPMKRLSALTAPGEKFARVKHTTQFIVGASDETDAEIVKYTHALYDRLRLNRVYFSAYQRGLGAPEIPGERAPGADILMREHRLYQVDFLFRKYGFALGDILFDGAGTLSLAADPKTQWAEAHPEFFPVDIRTAPREKLLRVPGIGPVAAGQIVALRARGRLRDPADFKVRGKRRAQILKYARFE
jgi:predicted DNA-binding helix-hairpin-helix protein